MSAELIVKALIEGGVSPEEFMSSLPDRVLNKFRFVDDQHGGPTKVYLNGPASSGFVGWIHPMGNTMWYAWRAVGSDGSHDADGKFRKTKEDAAQDLLDYVRKLPEALEPESFMSDLPREFWDTFLIAADGERSVIARHPYEGCYLVYRDAGDGTRDFVGYLSGEYDDNRRMVWEVEAIAVPREGKRTLTRKFVTGNKHSTKEEAAKELVAEYRRYNRL